MDDLREIHPWDDDPDEEDITHWASGTGRSLGDRNRLGTRDPFGLSPSANPRGVGHQGALMMDIKIAAILMGVRATSGHAVCGD